MKSNLPFIIYFQNIEINKNFQIYNRKQKYTGKNSVLLNINIENP